MLDLIGSTFIGGLLLVLILKLNLYSQNASYNSDSELKLQQNAKTLAEIMINIWPYFGNDDPEGIEGLFGYDPAGVRGNTLY